MKPVVKQTANVGEVLLTICEKSHTGLVLSRLTKSNTRLGTLAGTVLTSNFINVSWRIKLHIFPPYWLAQSRFKIFRCCKYCQVRSLSAAAFTDHPPLSLVECFALECRLMFEGLIFLLPLDGKESCIYNLPRLLSDHGSPCCSKCNSL